MAEPWDPDQLRSDGFVQVTHKIEWWDGPRFGIVVLDGAAHYFLRLDFDVVTELGELDDCGEDYVLWPVPEDLLAAEDELRARFVEWNTRYEAGTADTATHPAAPGVDDRYVELVALLGPRRVAPANARPMHVDWRFDDGQRYRTDGTNTWVRWRTVCGGKQLRTPCWHR